MALIQLVSSIDFVQLLKDQKQTLVVLHVWATCLGLGGATFADILFLKFVKNFSLSEKEHEILKIFSYVIWFSIIVLILTGLGLAIPFFDKFISIPKYLVKMIAVFVLVINGTLLSVIVSPRLSGVTFGAPYKNYEGKRWVRIMAFTCGPISIVSWYTAFLLGILRGLPFSFLEFLGAYVVLMLVAIGSSTILDRVILVRLRAKKTLQ